MRAPFAPPRLSVPRNVDADAQAVETSCGDGQPGREDLGLQGGDVLLADQLVVDGGDRVLPDSSSAGTHGPRYRGDGPHVAVRQLVPRPGEGVGELVGVLVEALRDRLVDRIHPQGEVRREHHRRVPLRRVVGVGHGALAPRRSLGVHCCAPAGLFVSSHS